MKQIKLFTGTFLVMNIILASVLSVFANQPSGHLDGINGNTIVGWAWNSSNHDATVDVTVVITNQDTKSVVNTITVPANIYRQNLVDSGWGTGNYGFEAPMDWNTVADGNYLIEAYVEDQKLTNHLQYTKSTTNAVNIPALRSLGLFRTTAYCPCRICSEGWGRKTSSGATAASNHTIAVDSKVIPMGTKIMIDGIVYTAEDRGGAVKGNHIDIFFNTHDETRQYGSRNVEVFLVP